MSKIYVDEITGFEGTETGAPITLSGDTVTLGTGTTLGSGVTFPDKIRDRDVWYPIHNGNSNSGDYLTSNDLDESTAFLSGCAPSGFSSVVGIKAYFISAGTNPGGWSVTIKWMISASGGAARNQHERNLGALNGGNTNFTSDAIRHIDIFNQSNDGNDFEDNISEGDVFGFRFTGSNTSGFLGGLGLKITWRF